MDICYNMNTCACSSVDRASVFGTEGRGFKSLQARHMWFVYIVECADLSLYTGITLDVERRIKEHNDSARGAKSIRYKRPVHLVYQEAYEDHRDAAKREYEIKQLKREAKIQLISGA